MLDALIASSDVQKAWEQAYLARSKPALFSHFGRRVHAANVRAVVTRLFPTLARCVELADDRIVDGVRTNPTSLSEREAIVHWASALERYLRETSPGEALLELLRIERAVALARAVPLPSLALGVERARSVGEWPASERTLDREGLFMVEMHTNVIDIYEHNPVADAVSFGPPRRFAFFSLEGGPVQRVQFTSTRELILSLGMHLLVT
ncbi:hypothetical protein [Hyalangium versicolor]|uniref:hypothetical protein n=1 Tax=Hyalangium versicolor TaxID=2861190 RepID=UPI001CCD7802|nr:hypothetical protein [Hyalangium versicolor]